MSISIFDPSRKHKRLLKPTEKPHVYLLEIDNSSLELFTTCPRKAEMKLVLGRDAGDKSALSYGTAIHMALEHLCLGKSLEDVCAMLHEYFMNHPVDEFEWRNYPFAVDAITDYLNRWGNAMQPHNGDPAYIETHFNVALPHPADGEHAETDLVIPVDNFLTYPKCLLVGGADDTDPAFYCEALRVRWTGRIDLLTKIDGAIWIVDRKTSSIGGNSFWNNFFLSSQMRGYVYAARQIFKDVTIKGVIVDAIFGRKPTRTGKAHEYERGYFEYTDESLAEWRVDTIQHIELFVSRLVRGMFPQSTQWCCAKFGTCKFFDVCKMPSALRAGYLMSNIYGENIWDPALPR